MSFVRSTCITLLAVWSASPATVNADADKKYVNEWAVEFHPSSGTSYRAQAEQFASAHELVLLGQVGPMENMFHYMRRTDCADHQTLEEPVHCLRRRAALDHDDGFVELAQAHEDVSWVMQQHVVQRHRRDGEVVDVDEREGRSSADTQESLEDSEFHSEHARLPVEDTKHYYRDPKFAEQWHFHNNEQDLRVIPLWEQGVTGKGVVVTVVDDGIEHTHPDLSRQYDAAASYDLNSMDDDPFPREEDPINKHGTRCSGEIAAQEDNDVCGVGVAYNARIGGIRLIDGDVTDVLEAKALGHAPQYIDIYSSSWGPDDDGRTVEGPGPLCQAAIRKGITEGRGGKGSVYVFAGGNGKRNDNCNCDGYTNSIYTLSIGAIDFQNKWPWYSEPCCATIASTYSSGINSKKYITTVDMHNGCTAAHSGTSAAAPLAAGIYALLLEVAPDLNWRDVQHLTIASVRYHEDVQDMSTSWRINGAGKPFSHQWGFGVIDTTRMIELSRNWTSVGKQEAYSSAVREVNKAITSPESMSELVSIIIVSDAEKVKYLEHTTVNVTITHQHRGKLAIWLVSPSGTESELLTPRTYDRSRDGFTDWTFMTLFNWGESPIGEWALRIKDGSDGREEGRLVRWQLNLFGSEIPCVHAELCRPDAVPEVQPNPVPDEILDDIEPPVNPTPTPSPTLSGSTVAVAASASASLSSTSSTSADVTPSAKTEPIVSPQPSTTPTARASEPVEQPPQEGGDHETGSVPEPTSTSTDKVEGTASSGIGEQSTATVAATATAQDGEMVDEEVVPVSWIYSWPVEIAAVLVLLVSIGFLGWATYRGFVAVGWVRPRAEPTFEGVDFLRLQNDSDSYDEDEDIFDQRNSRAALGDEDFYDQDPDDHELGFSEA